MLKSSCVLLVRLERFYLHALRNCSCRWVRTSFNVSIWVQRQERSFCVKSIIYRVFAVFFFLSLHNSGVRVSLCSCKFEHILICTFFGALGRHAVPWACLCDLTPTATALHTPGPRSRYYSAVWSVDLLSWFWWFPGCRQIFYTVISWWIFQLGMFVETFVKTTPLSSFLTLSITPVYGGVINIPVLVNQ